MKTQVLDFIIRIKNACLAKRQKLVVPYSKMNKIIGELLIKEHFLENIKEEEKDGKKVLVIQIRQEKRIPIIDGVLIVSKPSLSVHIKAKNIQKEQRKEGRGIAVFSTSQGIMTGSQAHKKGIGGEFLFKIW